MSVNPLVFQRRLAKQSSPLVLPQHSTSVPLATHSTAQYAPAQQPQPQQPVVHPGLLGLDPRKWVSYHYVQVAYILFGIFEVAVSSSILRHLPPRYAKVANTDLDLTKAPALLFTISGVTDLVVGVFGFRIYVELISKAINPVKTYKIMAHMLVLMATYYSISGLYVDMPRGQIVTSLLPLVLSSLLFLQVDHVVYYTTLLKTHAVRTTPSLEVLFPLVLSLYAFAITHAQLTHHTAAHIGSESHSGKLSRSVFQMDILFGTLYAFHALWLTWPGICNYYKLEFMVELLLLLMRVVFTINMV
jgi:hypothetical protein